MDDKQLNIQVDYHKKIDEIIKEHTRICPLCNGSGKGIWDKSALLKYIMKHHKNRYGKSVSLNHAYKIYNRFIKPI